MQRWVAEKREQYTVTQRLTENQYFAELRAAALGDAFATAPVGPGPPEHAEATRPIPKAHEVADVVSSAVEEALAMLDEARGGAANTGAADIRVLGVGPGADAVLGALSARLRPSEQRRLKAAVQPEPAVVWAAATSSNDLVLAVGGGLDVAHRSFICEALRVLAPGGHMVMLLREGAASGAEWLALLDEHERTSRSKAAATGGLRLVHKTCPRPLADGGAYRLYVLRSFVSGSAPPPSPPASPPAEAVIAPPPPTAPLAGGAPAGGAPAPDATPPIEPHRLFSWASDFYSSMQGVFGDELEDVLARRRDESKVSDDVCGDKDSLDEVMARFDASGVIPELGLVQQEAVGEHYNAESGARVGRAFAETYLRELEGKVVAKEMRLQAGNYIGHMAGSLAPWTAPISRLVTFLHCNNVKTETAKTTTYAERECMARMHKMFYDCDEAFYAEHSMSDSACLGHPTSGGTVANLQALWTARNSSHGFDKKGGVSADEGVVLVSALGHYSISKSIDVLGLGTANVVTIPTRRFKMDVAALSAKVDELVGVGRKIIAIVAVAGSTETGAFDPIRQMAAVARAHGIWLHVDAAWAGGLIFAPQVMAAIRLQPPSAAFSRLPNAVRLPPARLPICPLANFTSPCDCLAVTC